MPNVYKRKHPDRNVDESNLRNAIMDIKNGTETSSSASRKYGINRTTILYRLKIHRMGKVLIANKSSKYSHSQVLTSEQESELVAYLKKCSNLHHGMTFEMTKQFVFTYVKRNKINYPDSWNENRQAGKAWLTGFMRRNSSISLRKPENTSMARLHGFKKALVAHFFDNLKRQYEKYNFGPERIYNLDETGITTVLETPRVIAEKGKRTVSQVTSAERGSLVTMVGIVSATGNHAPPVYVFPRKRMNPNFLTGSTTGSIGLLSDSGWMNSDIFPDVLAHLKKHSNCSKDNPILLLLDNHTSHCGLDSVIYCRENGIVMLSFPPHTSHKLQPLDITVYGPFKTFCKKTFNNFLINNPGRVITIVDIAYLTSQPFQLAFSPANIVKGFSASGIYPFNDLIFPHEDYLDVCEATAANVDSQTEATINRSHLEEAVLVTDNIVETDQPASNTEYVDMVQFSNNDSPINSPSTFVNPLHLTPEQLRPVPKLRPKKNRANAATSKVYTDTPEKERIETLAAEKIAKAMKLKDRKRPKPVYVKRILDQSSSDETEISLCDESDQFVVSSEEEEELIPKLQRPLDLDAEIISPNANDYVLVKFGDKKLFYYVGVIQPIDETSSMPYTIKYLRRQNKQNCFCEPFNEDVGAAIKADIVAKLPPPDALPGTSKTRPKISFNVDFRNLDIR